MKARFFIAAVAASAALAACSERNMAPSAPEVPEITASEIYSTKNIKYPGQPVTDFITLPGEGITVLSSFDESTKTHIEMNSSGTFAGVYWNPGDSFVMLANNGDEELYGATFTTSEGGDVATFTSTGSLPSSNNFFGFYPTTQVYSFASYGLGYGFTISIPAEQTAVAGNVESGTIPSVCFSNPSSARIKFMSMASLLKFKLSGGLVSSINTVTLKASSPVSGPCYALVCNTNGSYNNFYYDVGLPGTSNKITLTGPFTADTDYYMVVAPEELSSFSLIFTGDGGFVTKSVSTPFSFERGHILDFGTIDIGDSYYEFPGPEAEQFMRSTSGLKPVTLVVVPDGFTAAEIPEFERLAKSGINALFATEPFKSYKSYFNVWLIPVASAESGANITDGNGTITTPRDCYFGSKWGVESYGDMNLDDNKLFNFVSTYCPDIVDRTHTVNEVPVLVIINDERYGGICHSWSNGKACCQAPVSFGGGTLRWDYPEITAVSESDPSQGTRQTTNDEYQDYGVNYGDWRNTLVHEYGGHAFSRLGDEYWYKNVGPSPATEAITQHSWPVPFALNISATYNAPPWKSDLLDRRAELMASDPLYSRIGVFQGGEVSPLNRWRCEKISCMIDNRFYFSSWQRELIVKRIMTLAGATFDLAQFLSKDVAIDPVRDVVSSGVMDPKGNDAGLAPLMPPLPPPVLHD